MTPNDHEQSGESAGSSGSAKEHHSGTSRRDFLKIAGGLGIAAGTIAVAPTSAWAAKNFYVKSSSAKLVMAVYGASPSPGQKAVAAQFEKDTGASVTYEAYPATDWNGFFEKVLT